MKLELSAFGQGKKLVQKRQTLSQGELVGANLNGVSSVVQIVLHDDNDRWRMGQQRSHLLGAASRNGRVCIGYRRSVYRFGCGCGVSIGRNL